MKVMRAAVVFVTISVCPSLQAEAGPEPMKPTSARLQVHQADAIGTMRQPMGVSSPRTVMW